MAKIPILREACWLNQDPDREPDWAWRFVKYLVETKRPTGRPRHGPYIEVARRLVVATLNNHELDGPAWQKARESGVHVAHSIYVQKNQAVRWELEARILAKEDTAVIAQKMGISSNAVKAFTALFFDVLDKNDSFVAHMVFGAAEQRFTAQRGQELLWKTVGYRYGGAALDLVIYGEKELLNSPEITTAGILEKAVTLVVESKRARAAHVLDVTGALGTVLHPGRGHAGNARVAQLEAENQDIRAGIQSMLDNLPWTKDRAEAERRGLIHPIETKTGASLRAHELLKYPDGNLPKELVDEINSAKYPQPSKSKVVTTEAMQKKLDK